ncbi:MAG TPA: PTS sugar transporter subunit IIA [Casimicrobiaceae bacterium]|nr:PTS sugar transporter subunit IIA [Casimicrobiaceae bacterium]
MNLWSGLAWPRRVVTTLHRKPASALPRVSASPFPSGVHPQEIALDVDANDSASLLAIAAAYIGRGHGLDPAPIARALLRREEAGSTALGHGVAVPHARVTGIGRPLTLFLRTRHPVAFGAPDGEDVSNFFIIIVPAEGDTDRHLELLAGVAAAFGDRAFRAGLAMATTANQVDDAFGGRSAATPLHQTSRLAT